MLTLDTAPTALLVSLAQLKAHLAIIGTDDDQRLTDMLGDARDYLESQYNLCFAEQVWIQTMWGFPCTHFTIDKCPVLELVITYYDAGNVFKTLADTDYYVVKSTHQCVVYPRESFPSTYNRPDSVQIEILAGIDEVPGDVKRACLELCGEMNEHRGDDASPSNGVDRLIRNRRRGFIC